MGDDEIKYINTTDMYGAHTELCLNIENIRDGETIKEIVDTTFVFYHPDKKRAKSIAEYIQYSGPEERVREILYPLFDKFERDIQNIRNTKIHNTKYYCRGSKSDYHVFKAEPAIFRSYKVDIFFNGPEFDIFEFHIPYDPLQFMELYQEAWGGNYTKSAKKK